MSALFDCVVSGDYSPPILFPSKPTQEELHRQAGLQGLIGAQVVGTITSILNDSAVLASLAVNMPHRYRQAHSRRQEMLEELESRRIDVETKLADFVKAIAMGIMDETTPGITRGSAEESRRKITPASLTEAKETGEVLNIEFDTSPRSGVQGVHVELVVTGDYLLLTVSS